MSDHCPVITEMKCGWTKEEEIKGKKEIGNGHPVTPESHMDRPSKSGLWEFL